MSTWFWLAVLARLLSRAGDNDGARREAREALRLRPDYADAGDFLRQLPPSQN